MSARVFLLGAGVAIGGLMMIPGVAGAVGRAGRPILRRGIRTGAAAYSEAMHAAAELYEHVEDVAAEVRAEMAEAAEDAAETAEAAAGAEDAPGDAGAGPLRDAG